MNGLLEILAESSVRITVVAAAVGLVAWAARIRSGAVRHAVWAATMVAMLGMPALVRVVPEVGVPVLQKEVREAPARRAETVPATVPIPVVEVNAPVATVLAVSERRPVDWWGVLLAIYAAGVGILLLRQAAGWWAMRRLVRGAEPTMAGDVAVIESGAVSTAVVCGVFRPRVVLPRGWREWSQEKLAMVLEHEGAHIRRRDPLTAFVARINCAVFWFHPVAWWLQRKIAAAAELACDDAVVKKMREPAAYAAALVEIAEAVRRGGGRVSWDGLGDAIGMAGAGALTGRVDRLLREDAMKATPMVRKVVVGVLCAGFVYLGAACTAKQTSQPGPELAMLETPLPQSILQTVPQRPQCQAPPGRSAELIEGRVKAGQAFSQTTPSGWVLRLVPEQNGWMLQVGAKLQGDDDYSRLTPPWHGVPNPRQIEGWHFRNADNTGPNDGSVNAPGELREFIFSPQVGHGIDYKGSATAAGDVETVRAFGQGWLHVDQSELSPVEKGKRASFESMQFTACLTWPAAAGPPWIGKEDEAIARVKHLDVKDLDPSQSNMELRYWFTTVAAPGAPVSYEMNDCGEQTGGPADRDREIPLCVEVRTITKAGATASASILVGNTKLGVSSGKPVVYFAVLEQDGRTHWAKTLGDLARGMPAPELPYVDKGVCPGEGCVYREWMARKDVGVFDTWRDGRKSTGMIREGDKVTAVTGLVVTRRPGMIRVDRDVPKAGLKTGDTILTYTYLGEGFSQVWVKGRFVASYELDFVKWPDGGGCAPVRCAATYVDQGEKEWWVQVKLASGETVWVQTDRTLFAGTDRFSVL